MNKLVVILGPTAVGKSSLAIKLARKFRGEIISADSRQVYKGMNIGTGKVTTQEQKLVPHHLLDVASPKKQFTVSDFIMGAKKSIDKIYSKRKIPFIVGGTAFYIYSLLGDWQIPEVKPNLKLRKTLQKKNIKELFLILKNLDPKRAKNIDKNNPARLIRAIEINVATGKPVPAILSESMKKDSSSSTQNDNVLLLGIKKEPEELKKLINKRVDQRLKQEMVAEVKRLRKDGISFKRLEAFGLEYRFIAKYLQDQLEYNDMVAKLKTAIYHFAKRQMTWFKRDSRIKWIKNEQEAEKPIKTFLTKK